MNAKGRLAARPRQLPQRWAEAATAAAALPRARARRRGAAAWPTRLLEQLDVAAQLLQLAPAAGQGLNLDAHPHHAGVARCLLQALAQGGQGHSLGEAALLGKGGVGGGGRGEECGRGVFETGVGGAQLPGKVWKGGLEPWPGLHNSRARRGARPERRSKRQRTVPAGSAAPSNPAPFAATHLRLLGDLAAELQGEHRLGLEAAPGQGKRELHAGPGLLAAAGLLKCQLLLWKLPVGSLALGLLTRGRGLLLGAGGGAIVGASRGGSIGRRGGSGGLGLCFGAHGQAASPAGGAAAAGQQQAAGTCAGGRTSEVASPVATQHE